MENAETNSPEAVETSEQTTPEATTETAETTEAADVEMVTEEVEETSPETLYADKFKSVGELEKSYSELQAAFSKKLGAFEGAPKDGYQIAEGFVTEDNQPLVGMLTGWGADNQLSNDGLNSLVFQYTEHQAAQHEAKINAEFAKLGEDANARLTNARSFLEANLGAEAAQALGAGMNSAVAIEAIEKLISLSKAPKQAETQSTQMVDETKIKEMRFAVDDNGNRMMEDPAYRQRVLKLEAQLQR